MQKAQKRKRQRTDLEQIKIPKSYSLERSGVTQSLLQAFQCCRMRWLLKLHGYRNTLKNRVTVFGTVMHALLERVYLNGVPSQGLYQEWILDIRKKEVNALRAVGEEQIQVDLWKAEALFFAYCKYWKDDFNPTRIVATEYEFAIPFYQTLLRGKIDAREMDTAGDVWLWEHKFLSRIEEDVLDVKLSMDLQSQFYLLADHAERREWAKGIKYNIIRKPGLRPKAKETQTDFLHRIRDDINARPEHYFHRYRVIWTDKNRCAFMNELMIKLQEMKMVMKGALRIWKNQSACVSPYKCDYLDTCSTGSLLNYERGPLFPELTNAKHVGQNIKERKDA